MNSNSSKNEELARIVLELEGAAASQVWVRRRTERMIFEDERVVGREVELQFDLSMWRDRILECNGSEPNVPIPLQTTGIAQTGTVEIFDETGNRIPYLNLDVERSLVRDGLRETLRGLFQAEQTERASSGTQFVFPGDDELDAFLAEGMRPLVLDTRPRWRKRLEEAFDIPSGAVEWGSPLPKILFPLSIHRRQKALQLAAVWGRKRMCLALLDVKLLGQTHLIRFRTQEEIDPQRLRWLKLARRLALGSLSWNVSREMSNANRAASFHVHAAAVPGFKVIDPGLRVADHTDIVRHGHWFHGESGRPSSHIVYHPDPDKSDPDDVTLYVSLYAHRTGFVSESAVASLFVGILLLVFTLRLDHVNFNVGEAVFNAPFASAVLLFLPVFLSAIAVYKDSARIAASAFAYMRLFLFLQFIAVVTAAIPFTFDLSTNTAETLWWIAVAVGWAACLRVIGAAGLHSWRASDVASEWRVLRRNYQMATRWEAWFSELGRRKAACSSAWVHLEMSRSAEQKAGDDYGRELQRLRVSIKNAKDESEASGSGESVRSMKWARGLLQQVSKTECAQAALNAAREGAERCEESYQQTSARLRHATHCTQALAHQPGCDSEQLDAAVLLMSELDEMAARAARDWEFRSDWIPRGGQP